MVDPIPQGGRGVEGSGSDPQSELSPGEVVKRAREGLEAERARQRETLAGKVDRLLEIDGQLSELDGQVATVCSSIDELNGVIAEARGLGISFDSGQQLLKKRWDSLTEEVVSLRGEKSAALEELAVRMAYNLENEVHQFSAGKWCSPDGETIDLSQRGRLFCEILVNEIFHGRKAEDSRSCLSNAGFGYGSLKAKILEYVSTKRLDGVESEVETALRSAVRDVRAKFAQSRQNYLYGPGWTSNLAALALIDSKSGAVFGEVRRDVTEAFERHLAPVKFPFGKGRHKNALPGILTECLLGERQDVNGAFFYEHRHSFLAEGYRREHAELAEEIKRLGESVQRLSGLYEDTLGRPSNLGPDFAAWFGRGFKAPLSASNVRFQEKTLEHAFADLSGVLSFVEKTWDKIDARLEQ